MLRWNLKSPITIPEDLEAGNIPRMEGSMTRGTHANEMENQKIQDRKERQKKAWSAAGTLNPGKLFNSENGIKMTRRNQKWEWIAKKWFVWGCPNEQYDKKVKLNSYTVQRKLINWDHISFKKAKNRPLDNP